MFGEKALLEENPAVVGGVHWEVVLTCQDIRMAQQATGRHFPRLSKNGLIIAMGEGFPMWCTIPHRLPSAALGKLKSPWP